MSLPDISSREDWLAARIALLAREKELTRARDALNADRRRLPMVRIEKAYAFEGPGGRVAAARSLRRPAAALPPALHVRPRVGRWLPELLGRGGRAGRGDCSSTCISATRPSRRYRARRSRRSRTTASARAGASRGTRRPGATSTTTSTPRSTSRSRRSKFNYRSRDEIEASAGEAAKWVLTAEQPFEMPGFSCFLRDGDEYLPHLLDVRPRHRGDRRRVRVPRSDRARTSGGVGGAEGPRRERPRSDAELRDLRFRRQGPRSRCVQSLGAGASAPVRTSGASCGYSARWRRRRHGVRGVARSSRARGFRGRSRAQLRVAAVARRRTRAADGWCDRRWT